MEQRPTYRANVALDITLAIMSMLRSTVIGVLLFPSVVLSQTLCHKGEIDYFSCQTSSNGKLLSICGNVIDGNLTDDSWVQYRFGRTDRIELVYPALKTNSASEFEGVYFSRYGVASIRFINGKTLYDVSLAQRRQDEDSGEQIQPSGGVTVAFTKTRHVNINCKTVDVAKYSGAFSQLATSLGPYHGKEDILYYFYNEVAK